MDNTLSVASINLILYAAQQKGADFDKLCAEVGFDKNTLKNPDGRMKIRQVQQLWKAAIEMTGDENLPLHLGEIINPVAVGILAYVMMHSPTLEKALEKLCHYQDIVCEGIRTTVELQGNNAILKLKILTDEIIYPHYALESEVSIYASAFYSMTGKHLIINELHFEYDQPNDVSEYHRIFPKARLVFNSSFNGMVFDRALLDMPILNANPNLFPIFEQHADEILRKIQHKSTIAQQVKQQILFCLKGVEPNLTQISRNLGIGVRTIQTKLKEEGVTFRELLDNVRQDLAEKHLREQHLSTTDIAYLLGFSEPSVFFRTFKKWTGTTPNSYRKSA